MMSLDSTILEKCKNKSDRMRDREKSERRASNRLPGMYSHVSHNNREVLRNVLLCNLFAVKYDVTSPDTTNMISGECWQCVHSIYSDSLLLPECSVLLFFVLHHHECFVNAAQCSALAISPGYCAIQMNFFIIARWFHYDNIMDCEFKGSFP